MARWFESLPIHGKLMATALGVSDDLNQARHVEWSGAPVQIERRGYVTVTVRR
jgi:hypothetical protein